MADRTVTVIFRAVIDQYKKATAEAADATKKLDKDVEQLGAKGSKSLKDMAGEMLGISDKTALVAGGVAAAGAAVLATVKGVQYAVDAYSSLADQVSAYQDVTGDTAESSSRMVFVANELGVSTESLAGGMFRLGRATVTNAEALERFGVDVVRNSDGNVNLTATLLEVSDAYRGLGDAGERAALVQAAFGRGGDDLIKILEQGSLRLNDMQRKAKDLGVVLNQKDIDNVEKYDAALMELQLAFTGLAVVAGESLVPMLTDVADGLTRIVEKANDLPGGGLGNWFGKGVEIVGYGTGIMPVLNLLGDGDSEGGTVSWTTKVGGLVDQIRALATETNDIDPILNYADALDAIAESAFAVDEATSDIVGGVGDLAEAVRKGREDGDQWATSLNAATEAGLRNRTAIREMATGVLEMAATLREQGASEADIAGVTAMYRGELIETLTQLGFNRTEVERYLGVLGLIPSSINTTVTLDGSQAFEVLRRLHSSVWGLQSSFRRAMGLNPWAGDAALTDALAGLGGIAPAADPSSRSPEAESRSRVDEALRARQEQDRRMAARAEFGDVTVDEYKAYLNARIAATEAYTSEWVDLMHEIDQVNEDIGEGWRDAAEYMQLLEDSWWEMLSRQHEVGDISTAEYLKQLRERLAGLQEFSDEWMDVWREIQSISDDGNLELIAAVEKQRQFDQAFYGLMEQRMLDNLRNLTPALQSPVVVQGGSTRTSSYSPQITVVTSDPARAGDSVNQRMRDDAFLQGL